MMRRSILLIALGFLAWAALPATTPASTNEEPPDPSVLREKGIEILASGPVHEAFAEPYTGKAQPTPAIPNAPPKQVDEIPPDQKPEGEVQWIPGYWQWDEERKDYIWVSGFWRKPPPGRRWMPGHWKQTAEGYQWAPGFWADNGQKNMNLLPQPPEQLEIGPTVPAPSEDYQYVPGTWLYRGDGFAWRPGFWTLGRPGWVWCPARYVWTPNGYIFVDGYWDFCPEDRGLLCAPVWFDRPLFRLSGWCYQPCFFWRSSCFFDSLFIRPGCGNYFFGNYFDPFWAGRGFCPWFGWRIGGHACDPFFNYARWNNRRNPGWEQGVQNQFAARQRGDFVRPPRTLSEQNAVVQNIQNINVGGKNNQVNATIANSIARAGKDSTIDQVSVLAPLNRAKQSDTKLQRISDQDREVARMSAHDLQRQGRERELREGNVVGLNGDKLSQISRPVKVELPQASVRSTAGTGRVDTPPPPAQSDVRLGSTSPAQGVPLKLGPAPNPPGLNVNTNPVSPNVNVNPNANVNPLNDKAKPRNDPPGRDSLKTLIDGMPAMPSVGAGKLDPRRTDSGLPKTEFKAGSQPPPTGNTGPAKAEFKAAPASNTNPGPASITNPAPPKVEFKAGSQPSISNPSTPKVELRSSPAPAPPVANSPPPSAPRILTPSAPSAAPAAPRISAPSAPRISAPSPGPSRPAAPAGGGRKK